LRRCTAISEGDGNAQEYQAGSWNPPIRVKTRLDKAPPGNRAAEPVKVRMYRQGRGDCCLLHFPKPDGGAFWMMIDCGIIVGTPDAKEIMTSVVDDVATVTGGRLDVLVITHEHWDHVSGLLQAADVFKTRLKIDCVWFGWTEDPGNPLARKLAAERKRAVQALRMTAQRLHASNSALAGGVSKLLEFFGESLGVAGGTRTSDAVRAAGEYSRRAPRYCRPTDPPIVLPELPGIRFYVLAPPQNEQAIKKSNPSKRSTETYEEAVAVDANSAFFAAALHNLAGAEDSPFADKGLVEQSCPFDISQQVNPEEAKDWPFFHDNYFAEEIAWRKIENQWLEVASQLALQLDSHTNNTSLVLAIELVASGKVLLFAADAQVGSWLSWQDLRWTIKDGNRTETVTGKELLRRTVLYKVGHHGSHNATLRELGLEEMNSSELMAMIPVDHDMAVNKRWNMPFPPLLDRLAQKTRGRILRIDDKIAAADRGTPENVPPALWKEFQQRATYRDLYVELSVDNCPGA